MKDCNPLEAVLAVCLFLDKRTPKEIMGWLYIDRDERFRKEKALELEELPFHVFFKELGPMYKARLVQGAMLDCSGEAEGRIFVGRKKKG